MDMTIRPIRTDERKYTSVQNRQKARKVQKVRMWQMKRKTGRFKKHRMMHEKFEVVEVIERMALLANRRLDERELPEGLYQYDIRGGEELTYSTIEPKVVVNYSGTLLFTEPLFFGSKGYIELDEDTTVNFSGEEMTVAEFMKHCVLQMPDKEQTLTMNLEE